MTKRAATGTRKRPGMIGSGVADSTSLGVSAALWLRGAIVICVALCLCSFSSVAGAQAVDWPSERPPRPLAAREVKFPPYELQKLPNGLQVVVVLHHEEPAVSMRLLIRAGSALDPRGKLGLAHLAAGLLDQGTTTRSAQEIADAVDFIGGVESTDAGTDLCYLDMVVMKDSLQTGMRMLSDMARHPAFSQAEIDRQRQQTLSGLRVQQEDPGYVADKVFDRLVYGFHPYGLPQSGTPETIGAVTRDDMVAFHGKYFVPNNAILAIVGDVTTEEAIAAAKGAFGDWEPHDVPADSFIDPPDPTERVIVINRPDAVQTEMRVGHLGVARNSPDYMALNLAIRILGGEGSNRLHQVLRTERSLTYGAQAEMDTLKRSGDFEAQTNTRSEATGEVLRLVINEFRRLQRDRVRDIELADAKAYLTGSFPLTIETPDQIAMQVLNVLFYDLPVEQLQTFRQRVSAVTVDDIQRVAREYLKPDRLSIVLVGNAATFAVQLKDIGFANVETIDLPDLDLTSVDFKHIKTAWGGAAGSHRASGLGGIGGTGAAAIRLASYRLQQPRAPVPSATEEEGARAKALLDEVTAAKGGLETLRATRGITARTTATMATPSGDLKADTTTYLEYPNRVRIETKLPDRTIVQVFDGEHAWVRDPTGVHDVPEPLMREVTASLRRDTVSVLLAAQDGKVRARALADTKDDSGAVLHSLELSGADFEPMVLYIDPKSGLISRQTYVAGGPGQPLVEELFSDYRPIDGVQMAFTAAVRRGGQQVLERRITDVKINAPIDPGLFKRPVP